MPGVGNTGYDGISFNAGDDIQSKKNKKNKNKKKAYQNEGL